MPLNKWDKRFMALAEHIASWSRDPSTKVGAVIVDDKKRIVSVGFNGFPRGIADDERLNDKTEKYEHIIHAEINALTFAQRNLEGCTLYVWPLPPCARCATQIIQNGISRVVAPLPSKDTTWLESLIRAAKMFDEAGIKLCYFEKAE